MNSHSHISEITITENKRLQKIVHEVSLAFEKFNPAFRDIAYQDFEQYLPVLERYQAQVFYYLEHVLRATPGSTVMIACNDFTSGLNRCIENRSGSLSVLEKSFYKLVSVTAKATIDVLKDLNKNEIAALNDRITSLELNQQQAKAGRDNPRSTLFQA